MRNFEQIREDDRGYAGVIAAGFLVGGIASAGILIAHNNDRPDEVPLPNDFAVCDASDLAHPAVTEDEIQVLWDDFESQSTEGSPTVDGANELGGLACRAESEAQELHLTDAGIEIATQQALAQR